MIRRRRHKRETAESELNLAAMLDMAFQLLTFFILTFKPAPVEGQIELRMAPPRPVTQVPGEPPAGSVIAKDPARGMETLIVSVLPANNGSGEIGSMAVGSQTAVSLPDLGRKLRSSLNDPASPFEQVILQAGSELRYESLMKIIDVCTRQQLSNGKKLERLSVVEVASGERY